MTATAIKEQRREMMANLPPNPSPKPRAVLLATPCYGGQATTGFMQSAMKLSELCHSSKVPFGLILMDSESLIPRARNNLAAAFLDYKQATHLLFIDADISFDPRHVLRLLSIQSPDPADDPYDILCGIYSRKEIQWQKVWEAARKEGVTPETLRYFASPPVLNARMSEGVLRRAAERREPVEVDEAGTGCMLIRRATFEKVAAHFNDTAVSLRLMNERYLEDKGNRFAWIAAEASFNYKADYKGTSFEDKGIHGFFNLLIHPEQRRLLSEDYAFCWRARQAGLRVWVDLFTRLGHTGPYTYEHRLVIEKHDGRSDSSFSDSSDQKQRNDAQGFSRIDG